MTSWTEVEKGRYERPFDHIERLLWLVGATTAELGKDELHLFVAVNICVGSTGVGDERIITALRSAWCRLRFGFPNIATTTDGSKITYTVPDEECITGWLEETLIVDTEAGSVEDVYANAGTTSMVKLHFLPNSSQLVLRTPHWRGDGRGIPRLFHHFLEHFAAILSGQDREPQLSWGWEVPRLSVSVEEAALMPAVASAAEEARIAKMTSSVLHGGPGLTLPYLGTADTAPGKPCRELLVLTESQTAAIVAACKHRDISVTTAVHAAIACANISRATPESKHEEYRSSIRRDLRGRVPAPHNGPVSAAALYTMASMVSVPPNGTWTDYVSRLSQEYRHGYPEDLFRLHGVYYRQLVEGVEQMAAEGVKRPPACTVDISSIGLAESLVRREYGEGDHAVAVSDLRVSVNTSSRGAGVFVWTFHDCLHLYMTYNEAYHTGPEMAGFLQDVKGTVLRELGMLMSRWL